jgi:hypothetical protein
MATAFRYYQIEPGGLWTSEPFPPADLPHIRQGVIAGFLSGHPRWATDLDGAFLFGLDASGHEIHAAPSPVTPPTYTYTVKPLALTPRQINAIVRAQDGRNVYVIRRRLGETKIQRVTRARTRHGGVEVYILDSGLWVPVTPELGDSVEAR